ncbi:MAG TPA: septation protein SepH [Actinomycetaceae bacterium]|nr:septation protein SepH [Actinomycetaceae bacterium]
MVELHLVGLHSDGERLILATPDGQQYHLPVDDALRAAVRRDRPQLEQLRAEAALRPREIQAKIRAGASAEEVAAEGGLPVAHVRRYEGPVIAEREWVVSQARALTVGRSEGAPSLGDLVIDRLATRDVDTKALRWDAVRPAGGSWQLVVHFRSGERDRSARWAVDLASRSARALDDESRWLSETEVATPAARRHLAPVPLYDPGADGDVGPALAAVDADLREVNPGETPAIDDDASIGDLPALSTEDLLSELRASRGQRAGLELDDNDGEGSLPHEEPTLWGSLPPAAHPPASRPEEARDAHVLPMPRTSAPTASSAEPSSADDGSTEPGSAQSRSTAPTPAAQEAPPAPQPEPSDDAEGSPREPAARDGAPEPRARGHHAARPRRRSRSGRASVPSWDEIVFGARPD